MKLLIIEDEPSLREIMQRALTQERYVVETATNYAEADAKIAAYSYDCILLDIMLPDGNGLQLLQHLKQQRKRETFSKRKKEESGHGFSALLLYWPQRPSGE